MSSREFEPVDADIEPYGVVAIASSAGGVVALGKVLGGLPANLAVPVLVVQHLHPRHKTVIAEVLGRRSKLNVKLAENGERIDRGTIYVAPPDRHLLVGKTHRLSLTESEVVHFLRPSADLLFESVAGAYGARAIACVLTGSGSDGAAGVRAVKARGGTVVVEDPGSAEFKGMPEAAVGTGTADFVVALDEISATITGLVAAGSPRS
jgi:two-component system chemotaxis response regulator CheB